MFLRFLIPALLIFSISTTASSQFYFVNIEELVTQRVREKMEKWSVKGEFEKTEDYQARIAKRDDTLDLFTQEAIEYYMKEHINRVDFSNFTVSEYDADSESYEITIDIIGDFILPVPLAGNQAQRFKEQSHRIRFTNPRFTIQDNSWLLTQIDARLDTFVYHYDINQNSTYNPKKDFSLNYDQLEVALPTSQKAPRRPTSGAGFEDLDNGYNINYNLPPASVARPDDIAIIIGNTVYQSTKWVDYAVNDVRLMEKYLIEVLGFRKGNVVTLENAKKGDFETYFGNSLNHKGRLYNMIKPRESKVFIFYAGHGAPGVDSKKGYFVPVECDPNLVELSGYPLEVFYQNLDKLDVEEIVVVIDACFSGAEILSNMSPIRVNQDKVVQAKDNLIVFSSSSGEQVSSWYNAKEQGLFTYFFLKALHDVQHSDKNKDNRLSYQEIYDYINEHDGGVKYYARRLHNREQTPTLQGGMDTKRTFIDFNRK